MWPRDEEPALVEECNEVVVAGDLTAESFLRALAGLVALL